MVNFAEALRRRMVESGKEKAVDWADNVADWIEDCIAAEGIPMFRTRFAKRRFDGLVLGVCWGVRGAVPSMWFKNVSPEDLQRLEAETGDWNWVLAKYGTEAQKRLHLTPEALRAFAEKRIPALEEAEGRKGKAERLMLRRDRMASVDRLAWASRVEPELREAGAEIEGMPELIVIRVTPEQAKGLSGGTWSILIEWGEQGVLFDQVEGRVEDLINLAIERALAALGVTEGREATHINAVMQSFVEGRDPGIALLQGLVTSTDIQRGRAELGVDDGTGTLLLLVRDEHLPDDLASAVRRDDVQALEDAILAEQVMVAARPTSLFLRAVSDGPLARSPTPMRQQLEEASP